MRADELTVGQIGVLIEPMRTGVAEEDEERRTFYQRCEGLASAGPAWVPVFRILVNQGRPNEKPRYSTGPMQQPTQIPAALALVDFQ